MNTLPQGVILVIRTDSDAEALLLGEAAIRAGVDAVEITLTVPGAHEVIRTLTAFGTPIGVGTVLHPDEVAPAVAAGASFVVSPHTNAAIIDAAHAAGAAVVAGGLTPTEIQHAFELGADAVKVFPALSVGGPDYIREVRGPLPLPPLVISGGVDAASAPDYLAAGAGAVCVARAMFPEELVIAAELEPLVRAAEDFLARARA